MVQLILSFDTIYPIASVLFSFMTLISVIILWKRMKSNALVLAARLYTSRVKYFSFFVLFIAALSFMIGYVFFAAGYVEYLFFGLSSSNINFLDDFNSYTDLIAFGSIAVFFFILSYKRSGKIKLEKEVTPPPNIRKYSTKAEIGAEEKRNYADDEQQK